MADVKWKLPKAFLKGLNRTQDNIRSMADHLRIEFDEMDEDWKGSDEGAEVEAWIDKLDDAHEALVEIAFEPG